MPHQPTIVGFPRRCSSDLTGDDIQRRKGEKVIHPNEATSLINRQLWKCTFKMNTSVMIGQLPK